MNNSPIIAFAKNTSDRDFLREYTKEWDHPILFFENETLFFDNLPSIRPKVIVIKTDSRAVVWRFIFALHTLKINGLLYIATNAFAGSLFNLDGVKVPVHCSLSKSDTSALPDILKQTVLGARHTESSTAHDLLVGESPEIKRINASLSGLRASFDSVLITGESGTGKELLARRIADFGKDGSIFVKVNCSYFTSEKFGFLNRDTVDSEGPLSACGKLDQAPPSRVTVLFDKIHQLGKVGQSEVLALLEDGIKPLCNLNAPFRVIATTETALEHLVEQDVFRQDLYYRLNVIPVNLPPLRQRKEDLPLLMDYLAIMACSRLKRSNLLVSHRTTEKMNGYQWPGNVDELKRAMERFAASGDEAHILAHIGYNEANDNNRILTSLEHCSLPDSSDIQYYLSIVGSASLKSICDKFIEQTEKVILQRALESTRWNRKKAAELLNISYKSMLNKMKIYEIV